MKNNLFWDLDGTLTDPQEGVITCIQYALKKASKPVPAFSELFWCIGPPLHHSFQELCPESTEQECKQMVDFYRERFATKGILENKLYPGIRPLFEKLPHRKHFLATSKPLVFAREVLENFGLTSFFSGIYGSELNGDRTDKAELMAHILTEENLLASDVLMIGDRKFDVLGSQKLGIPCVGVLWGYGSRAELEEAGAWKLVHTEEELEKILI